MDKSSVVEQIASEVLVTEGIVERIVDWFLNNPGVSGELFIEELTRFNSGKFKNALEERVKKELLSIDKVKDVSSSRSIDDSLFNIFVELDRGPLSIRAEQKEPGSVEIILDGFRFERRLLDSPNRTELIETVVDLVNNNA